MSANTTCSTVTTIDVDGRWFSTNRAGLPVVLTVTKGQPRDRFGYGVVTTPYYATAETVAEGEVPAPVREAMVDIYARFARCSDYNLRPFAWRMDGANVLRDTFPEFDKRADR